MKYNVKETRNTKLDVCLHWIADNDNGDFDKNHLRDFVKALTDINSPLHNTVKERISNNYISLKNIMGNKGMLKNTDDIFVSCILDIDTLKVVSNDIRYTF